MSALTSRAARDTLPSLLANVDMRESMRKASIAPGKSAITPGDFFWCAAFVASDLVQTKSATIWM